MVDKIGEAVRTYWPIVAFAIAVAVAWGGSTMQISSIASGQDKILAKLEQLGEKAAGAEQTALAARNDIDYLRTRVDALETKRN